MNIALPTWCHLRRHNSHQHRISIAVLRLVGGLGHSIHAVGYNLRCHERLLQHFLLLCSTEQLPEKKKAMILWGNVTHCTCGNRFLKKHTGPSSPVRLDQFWRRCKLKNFLFSATAAILFGREEPTGPLVQWFCYLRTLHLLRISFYFSESWRVPGCNSIPDLSLKIVFWTHKFAVGTHWYWKQRVPGPISPKL